MNIQGNWTGSIIFGKEYRNFAGQTLYFDMEILQNNNNIQGTAYDIDGPGASPDSASISGEFVDRHIQFTKRYKSFHFYKNGITEIDKTKQGPEIKYTGYYEENEQSFKGDWILKGTIKLFGLIPLKYINTGTWSMKRRR